MLSMTHILLLLVVALVVFGPKRLPGLGKSLGEGLRNFKKGLSGEGDIDVTDTSKRLEEEKEKEKKS
ncbi:MAG: twin-arginine translocase TatA/TatE family subunit [Bdellovibrionales bacterium]